MKVLKQGEKQRIQEKIDKIKSDRAKKSLLMDFTIPLRARESNKSEINEYASRTENILPDIKDLLTHFRKHVPNVWDQTELCASYLLICKAYGTINPVLLIAREGYSHQVIELVRPALEAIELAFLFLEEKDKKTLKKWFDGKIISNEEARKMYHKVINEALKNKRGEIPLEDVKSDVYRIYSLFSHNAYIALLESVDPFSQDFDFPKNSGYHYTARNLHLIENLVINILLSLKEVFLKLGDYQGFLKTETLMKKIGYENASKKEIDKVFSEYKDKK